jgi:hypothetical protein
VWTIHQRNGLLEDFKGFRHGCGYAGHGEGKNNPILQDIRAGCRCINGWVPIEGLTENDWGPLPRGIYTMQEPVDTPSHGPYVLWLTPDPANEMFHRSGFGIHGDSLEHPGLASEGCFCVPRATRELMWGSNDHKIQVIE